MKKIKIIIFICILITIGGAFGYMIFKSKVKPIILSETQIKNNSKMINELMDSINENNFAEYKKLTDNEMNTNITFEKIRSITRSDLGEYKSSTFKEGVVKNGQVILIYSGKFSKVGSIDIPVAMTNNKIVGLYYTK